MTSEKQSYHQTLEKALERNFLTEFAIGWEDDTVLIERFDIDPANWKKIQNDKFYQAEVSRVRAELEKDGRMSKYKARLLAHDLIDVVYKEAITPETPLERKIDALKVLSSLAEMGPKQAAKSETIGTGVQITLNLAPQPKPISVEVSQPTSPSDGDNTAITPQSLEDKSDV